MNSLLPRMQAAWFLFLAALFTLPVIGLGVLKTATGRDWGAGLQPSWALLALATIWVLPELIHYLRSNRQSWLPAVWPAAVALGLSAVGVWLVPSGETIPDALWRYGKQVIQLGVMLVFIIVPAYHLNAGRSLKIMARVVVFGAFFQLLYCVLQAVHFYHPFGVMAELESLFTSNPAILAGSEQLYLNNSLMNIPRLRGTACEPLYFGNYLLLVLPLVWLTGWRRMPQIILTIAFGLLLIFTWSRGAWLAAIVAMVFVIAIGPRFGVRLLTRQRIMISLGLFVMVSLVIWWGRPELRLPWERLLQSFSTVDWSNLTRFYSMQAAWRGFLLSPIVGIGWGQFGYHFALLVDPMGLQSMFSWPVVNNFPLQILCETGVAGLTGFLWLVRALGIKTMSRWDRSALSEGLVLVLLSAGVVGIWFQLLTFSQFNLPHIWICLGLMVGQLNSSHPVTPQRSSAV